MKMGAWGAGAKLRAWVPTQQVTAMVVTGNTPNSTLRSPTGLTVEEMSLGRNSICAITNDSSLYCWGESAYNLLGHVDWSGTNQHFGYTLPTQIPAFPGLWQTWQDPCPPGTWQNQTGQDFCYQSSPGHYVPVSGSAQQYPCQAGYWQDNFGQHTCRPASCWPLRRNQRINNPGNLLSRDLGEQDQSEPM